MSEDISLVSGIPPQRGLLSRVHICGIGGIGMSAVAHLLLDCGCRLTGSDLRQSELTEQLEARGVHIVYSPDPDLVQTASCIVISSHFPKKHPEVRAALQHMIPVLDRHMMLAEICKTFDLNACLCMGTLARGKLPRFASKIPHLGWSAGAVVIDSPLLHAKLEKNMMIDVDERDFVAHPEWFSGFCGSDILISDWENECGYYADDCSLDRLKSLAIDKLLDDDSRIIAPAKAESNQLAFEVIAKNGVVERVVYGLDEQHRVLISPENSQEMPYLGTKVDASAMVAAHIWFKLHQIPERPADLDCVGWFNQIRPRQYHEIRMHPVNIHVALGALKNLAASSPVHAVIKPFSSTLFAYSAEIWHEAFDGVSEVLIATPPYEGCTAIDCMQFRNQLERLGINAHCVSLDEAGQKSEHDRGFWLWIGAGDILPKV